MSNVSGNYHRKNSSGGDSVESKREQYKTTGRQKKAQDLKQKKGHVRAGSLNLPSVKFSHKRSCDQLIADLLVHLSTEKADPNETAKLACRLAKAAKKNAAKKKKEPLEVVTKLTSETWRKPEAMWPVIVENLKQAPPDKAKDGALYLHVLLEMMTAPNAPAPDEMAPDETAPVPNAIPHGSSISPQPMGTAVLSPYYGDPYAPTYYQGLPYSAVTAYGVPPSTSGPVVAPPQAPPPPIATSPVPITDWKDKMSACVDELLARLLDGDEDAVASGFELLREIARERKFGGDDLDGWIADALKDCTLQQLDCIAANAETLLLQGMLADSLRLGIARMRLPMKFIEAVIQEVPERWSIAVDLKKCCNPANRKDPKPTEEEAKSMMQKMLERALDRLSPPRLLFLNQMVPYSQGDPAMLVLKTLLKGNYAPAITDAETNI
jgi:hypothetical protein